MTLKICNKHSTKDGRAIVVTWHSHIDEECPMCLLEKTNPNINKIETMITELKDMVSDLQISLGEFENSLYKM